MDCSLPDSSVHGISQARILEWVSISFSRGSSWPRDQTQVSALQADSALTELQVQFSRSVVSDSATPGKIAVWCHLVIVYVILSKCLSLGEI